jgi:hypothetical protein
LGGQLTLTEHQPQGPFPEGVEGLFFDLLPGVYGFFLCHLISLSFHCSRKIMFWTGIAY